MTERTIEGGVQLLNPHPTTITRPAQYLWDSYPVYRRGKEAVVLHPITLESVFLDEAERAAAEAHEDEITGFLAEAGFLRRRLNDYRTALVERLASLHLSGKPTRISGYRVVVTDKCNMACSYCFVHTNTGKPDMTEADLRSGLDYLFEQNRGQRDVTIQWFGGEPTIRFDLMKLGSEYAEQLAAKHGVARVHNTVVTNGVLLKDEMIEHYQRYSFGVGVSFDGLPDYNGLERVLLSGKPADRTIHRNIERLLAAGVHVGCNLTPTQHNVDRIPEIVEWILSLGIRFVYVNTPIPASGRWHVPGRVLANSLYEARLILLRRGGMLFSSVDRVYQGLDSRNPKVFEHLQRDGSINAALLPGGRVSLCDLNWRDDRFIHTLEELRSDPSILDEIVKDLLPDERCRRCPAAAVCGGPSRNDISLRGTVTPDPEMCAFFTRVLELSLWDNTSLQ